MNVRIAEKKDFSELYALGLATPEFRVGAEGEFMEEGEFLSAIENPNGTFLQAEEEATIIGFIYASWRDIERGPQTTWACLVYLVVESRYRKQKVAQKLYDTCLKELQQHKITNVYGWANSESDGSIIRFLKKQGYQQGHKYIWMDKKI